MNFMTYSEDKKFFDPVECPFCGSANLRFESVTVFFRDRNNLDKGICSDTSRDMQCNVDTSMFANPSEDNNGISIWCECGHCSKYFDLQIVQNKDSVSIYWKEEKSDLIINN
jgi:hypothetical protein